jgi:hypothetical protein
MARTSSGFHGAHVVRLAVRLVEVFPVAAVLDEEFDLGVAGAQQGLEFGDAPLERRRREVVGVGHHELHAGCPPHPHSSLPSRQSSQIPSMFAASPRGSRSSFG